MEGEYRESPRISYGDEEATFLRVCPNCGIFVKADKNIKFNGEGHPEEKPNATCKKMWACRNDF